MRRQCWEAGTIDYLGKDSFDNIWKRITQTIETKPEEAPKRDRTPTPQPEDLPVDEKKEGNQAKQVVLSNHSHILLHSQAPAL